MPKRDSLLSLRLKVLKGFIVRCVTEARKFIFPIFLTPKKDGSCLNSKQFNDHAVYHHFKMGTIASTISMVKPQCFMAFVNLKDAFYPVPIS